MLYFAAALLIVSTILGQIEATRLPQDLRQHAAFIGNWEAKDVVIEGETCRAPVSWRYVLDGKFIEHRYVVINAGEANCVGHHHDRRRPDRPGNEVLGISKRWSVFHNEADTVRREVLCLGLHTGQGRWHAAGEQDRVRHRAGPIQVEHQLRQWRKERGGVCANA